MSGDSMLEYGMNYMWSTPVRAGNLLKEGVVGERLHSWLEKYADHPRFISGPVSRARYFARHDDSVFARPAHRELARIKGILIARADQYVRETVANPLPEHDKHATFFFVIQHPNNFAEALLPHYHEGSDVGLVYYLSTPSNGSGALAIFDPRGLISRGGRAFQKQMPGFDYSPRRGDLLILPRYVLHYTNVNTDANDRKVIAGVVKYDLPRRKATRFLVGVKGAKVPKSASK